MISLVGAGPGDIGLLTVKALDRIQKADVIIYDNLISASILNHASLYAKLVYVGKSAHHHTLTQEEINQLLVDSAARYQRIVRLKGGDPYIFGRGGEEAEVLQENGIDFEIIDGISSFYASLAYAGIPITHRDYASSFHVFTGHFKDDKAMDFSTMCKLSGTIVILMGLNNLEKIVAGLLAAGMDKDKDISLIENGTRYEQRCIRGTLDTILDLQRRYHIKSPAVIVLGEVNRLHLSWFVENKKDKSLYKKKVLLTGTRSFIDSIRDRLADEGADAAEISLIETVAKEHRFAEIEKIIHTYTYLVFTSANGVEAFFEGMKALKDFDLRSLYHKKIAVIGSATAKKLKEYGYIADFIPSKFTGLCLAKELPTLLSKEDKLLLLRAEESGKDLVEELEKRGIEYQDADIYETIIDDRRKEEFIRHIYEADYIPVASPSAVRAINKIIENKHILTNKIISIGEVTTRECQKFGIEVLKTAREYSARGLVEAMKEVKL